MMRLQSIREIDTHKLLATALRVYKEYSKKNWKGKNFKKALLIQYVYYIRGGLINFYSHRAFLALYLIYSELFNSNKLVEEILKL